MNANYIPRKKRANRLTIIAALFGTLCAVSAIAALVGYSLFAPQATSTPLVLIREPLHNEQLTLGERVTVHALARDKNKIARVEFWANGRLLETQTSSLPGGASPMPLVVGWQPATPGQHTLVVRAFNTQEQSGDASIVVEVAEIPTDDADNDTIPNTDDACPDEAGPASASGCPDADLDGIPDSEDACPAEIGAPEADGCPVVEADDRDGDRVADAEDACPDEAGLIPAEGCPDRDADLIPDIRDLCPDEFGLGDDGCPLLEAAGDGGVPAAEAPAGEGEPGSDGVPPEDAGIPEGGDPGLDIPDTDGDGMSDDADPCPFEPGTPEDGYCPPEEPGLPAPIPDGGDWETVYTVEFDALSFEVTSNEYEWVNCYVEAGNSGWESYRFEPSGANRWNLAEQLGGENSRSFRLVDDEPMRVSLQCWGWPGFPPSPYLGIKRVTHSRDEWDGRVLTMHSEEGEPVHGFTATYRLCTPDCDDAALLPPLIHTQYYWLGRQRLVWAWDGSPDTITGYLIYVDGARVDYTSNNVYEIEDYLPACGETRQIEVTAAIVSPTGIVESPHSNTWVIEGEPCPRIARITFVEFQTHDLPLDTGFEYCEGALGPLSGSLWVAGAETVSLPLNTGYRARWLGYLTGVCLHANRSHSIANIVNTCNSLPYSGLPASSTESSLIHCPESHIVEVTLGPEDNLSFGGTFSESDRGGGWQWIYNGARVLPPPPAGATGGTYTLSDGIGFMDLVVQVELLPSAP